MTMRFDVEIKGFDELRRKVRDPRLLRPITIAGRRSVEAIAGDARRDAPVGVTGEMRNSITTDEDRFGRPLPKWWRVIVGARHGKFVEFGTRPHFPPWGEGSPLREWVRLKLRAGNRAASVAFLIARAISRRGTRPQPFLRPAYERNKPRIRRFFRQALTDIRRFWGR